MLAIEVRRPARKFVDRLPAKQRRQIGRKLVQLRSDPNPPDAKRLKGRSSEFRRADVGEYRIIYRVERATLLVFLVGKRNDSEVYRRFERQMR